MSTAGEAGSLKNIRGKPAMDKRSGIFPWEIDREVIPYAFMLRSLEYVLVPYGPLGSSLDLILPSALMKEGNCGKQQKI